MHDDSDDDFFASIQRHDERASFHASVRQGEEALSLVGQDLDDRINFRVNAGLKEQFEKVCVLNHSTVSREIKRYMTQVVRFQKIF